MGHRHGLDRYGVTDHLLFDFVAFFFPTFPFLLSVLVPPFLKAAQLGASLAFHVPMMTFQS